MNPIPALATSPGTHLLGAATDAHPLAPLSPSEIDEAGRVLAAAGLIGETGRVSYLGLREPHKDAVLQFEAGGQRPDRLVRALVIDVKTGASGDVVLSLDTGSVVSHTPVEPGSGQVPLLNEEHEVVREVLGRSEAWADALARRGISDVDKAVVAALSAGRYEDERFAGRRLARALAFFQPTPESIAWAHPIEGLMALVDLVSQSVVDIVDTGAVPVPLEHGDYHVDGAFGPQRTTQKPIVITQPLGPSFSVDGTLVTWEKWQFRIGYDMREGLVLHRIGFEDGDRVRPIIHRASVSEMVVPYGEPSPVRFWQNYFDTGEYQLGNLVNSLELGCDCVGDITYFDVAVAGADGTARVVPNAICMHEEDAGILWKHTEEWPNRTDSRRQRRLVISFFVTIGNYDYGFYWNLYLDGTIELEAKATGIVFTSAYTEDSQPWASQLAPGLGAPYHQHLFNVRLDMMVDGADNTVDEVDVVRVPISPSNPWGNGIARQATRITSEAEGGRVANGSVDRTWRISSASSTDRFGEPTSYVLFPEGKALLAADPSSVIARRAAFATKHLWVTQYSPDELYAAGDIVNQGVLDGGLPAYVAQDRDLDGQDLVIWHTFGLTHFPRNEDWPIMPVDSCKLVLKPDNFFDRNPTLDVPAAQTSHCLPEHSAPGPAGHENCGATSPR